AGHRDAAAHYPENAYKHPEIYSTIYQTGMLPPRNGNEIGFVAYFAHPNEIQPLCYDAGFEVVTLLGLEGVVSTQEEKINALQGEAWDYWVRVNYDIAHDPSILGGVEHILAVCRKPMWHSQIKDIAAALKNAQIVYKIVGSAALAMQGVPLQVHDLDIELNVDDIYRMQALFQDNVVESVQYRESEYWRSHIGRIDFSGMQVEVMAGLERRVGQHWLPSMITTTKVVILDGIAVHVITLEEQVLAYLRQGRIERVSLALPFCDSVFLTQLLHDLTEQGYF
ncbi:MAG: hypothetical protein P1S60_19005, partial [Anaerolineae bacterium]|nr:hypothetical protein [Anaerolineae bacterium]